MKKDFKYENNFYKIIFTIKEKRIETFQDFLLEEKDIEGNIYFGEIVKINLNLNICFVKYDSNLIGLLSFKKNFKLNDKLLVQIIRQESKDKPALLSSFIKFYGIYLDYIPNSLESKIFSRNPNINFAFKDFKEGSLLIKSSLIKNIQEELNYFQEIFKKEYNLIGLVYEKKNYNTYQVANEENLKLLDEKIENFSENKIYFLENCFLYVEKTKVGYNFDINTGDSYKAIEEINKNAWNIILDMIVFKKLSGIFIIDFIGSSDEKNKILSLIKKSFPEEKVTLKGSTIEIIKKYSGYNYYEYICSTCKKFSFRHIITSLLRGNIIGKKKKFLYENLTKKEEEIIKTLGLFYKNKYIEN